MLNGRSFITSLSSQILFCFGTVLPDGANLFARVLIWAVATSFVTLDGHTFFYLAHVAAEVELYAIHTATCAIYTLWCNLIGVIHLAPFLSNFDAHLVVVLYRGNTSLTGLAVNATASNHFIHILRFLYSTVQRYEKKSIRSNVWDILHQFVTNGKDILHITEDAHDAKTHQ